jgi:hypothetical protein
MSQLQMSIPRLSNCFYCFSRDSASRTLFKLGSQARKIGSSQKTGSGFKIFCEFIQGYDFLHFVYKKGKQRGESE